jgi:steroid delta-isomerase-like uncharacterized protein/uncharacterized protein (TIGR02118 family)
MAKMIFVLQRRPDVTREEMAEQWRGEQHVSIVRTVPGLNRWVQNHIRSAPGEPVCDGIGELWFESDEVLQQALNSPEMGAAVEDAKRFLDMRSTCLLIVDEKTVAGLVPAYTEDCIMVNAVERSPAERALEDWGRYWSSHDMDRLLDLFTEDVVYEDVTMGAVNHGKDQLRRFGEGIFAGLPDVTFEVTSRFACSTSGALEWVMRGTHRGDLPAMPATDKQVEVRGGSILEFADGRIRRCSDYWDMATFLKQLGLSPAG